ncbi:hypothetical protein C41431_14 [Lactococcus phage C41431]|nr:hypothetical protein C41431_14 [Lactococcus phage C41431]
MVVKVFDAYIEGEKKATGTIDEIADYFDLSRNSIEIYRDIKSVFNNGKDMTWNQLFNFMDKQLTESLVVFE